jgi:hypothetical protein
MKFNKNHGSNGMNGALASAPKLTAPWSAEEDTMTEAGYTPPNKTAERDRQAAKALDEVVNDMAELAQIGSSLAKSRLGERLRPVKRMIASALVATVFGFAGLLDLIRLVVAYAIGGDVGVSRPWLGWSAFTLLVLAGIIGFFGTRRSVPARTNALMTTAEAGGSI